MTVLMFHIYWVDCFIFVWLRAGNIYIYIIFFSNSLNFCLFFSMSFFFFYFSVQLCVPRCPGTGNVFWRIILSFLWNCWYNDGDGWIGSLLLFINCMLNLSLGFTWHSEEETPYVNSQVRSYNMWECYGLSRTTLMRCKEKEKISRFHNTACAWALEIK